MAKDRTTRKPGLLTAGEVADHCRVSYEAVKRWVNTGKLKAYTTPGGHRRVRVEDFQEFLQKYRLPPHKAVGAPRRRVLIVDDDPAIVQLLTRFLGKMGEYDLATAEDGFDAGIGGVPVTGRWLFRVFSTMMAAEHES